MENVYQFNFDFILICRFTMKFCGLFFLPEYKSMYTENIWWLGKIFENMDSWKLDVVSYEKMLNNPGLHFKLPIVCFFRFYDSHIIPEVCHI